MCFVYVCYVYVCFVYVCYVYVCFVYVCCVCVLCVCVLCVCVLCMCATCICANIWLISVLFFLFAHIVPHLCVHFKSVCVSLNKKYQIPYSWISALFPASFFFILVFSTVITVKHILYLILPMTGIKLRTYGMCSNRSASWATTIPILSSQFNLRFPICPLREGTK